MKRLWWVALLGCLCLCACKPQAPIRIGLIAGLTSRTSDTGEAARNGLILAIEQRNAQSGIHVRRIEMIAAQILAVASKRWPWPTTPATGPFRRAD
jgi:branched-chain amino acid transport system substrate-binding protein